MDFRKCISCNKIKKIFKFVSLRKYCKDYENICKKCQKSLWIKCHNNNHWAEPSQFINLKNPNLQTKVCLDCRTTNLERKNRHRDKLKRYGTYKYCVGHNKLLPQSIFKKNKSLCEICRNKVFIDITGGKFKIRSIDFMNQFIYIKNNKKTKNNKKSNSEVTNDNWYDILNFKELNNTSTTNEFYNTITNLLGTTFD